MTEQVREYAGMLQKNGIPRDLLQQTSGILEAVPEIRVDFESPAVTIEKKHIVIDRVFPKGIRNFLKLLCDNQDFALYDAVTEAFDELTDLTGWYPLDRFIWEGDPEPTDAGDLRKIILDTIN